eukprot:SAG22_NODE_1402_length_4495_cov_2.728844_1_plen_701_part_00
MEGCIKAAKIKEAGSSWQDECDLRVDLAEALWVQKRFKDSIVQYDAALAIAQKHDDSDKVGMIYAGKACAMMHVGEPLDACVECYEESLAIATALKNPRQVDFVKQMIETTKQQWNLINGNRQAQSDSDKGTATASPAATPAAESHEAGSASDYDAIDMVIQCFRKSSTDPAASPSTPAETDSASTEADRHGASGTDKSDSSPTGHDVRTAVWDIPYADAVQMIGRGFPSGATAQATKACLVDNIPRFTAQFASCMRISSSQIDVRVGELCVEVRVPYSVLVAPMHAAFDADGDGYLSYKECQRFLADIHDVQWDEYKQFCDRISIDPDTGLNVDDLSTFYAGHDTSVLQEEYAQIFGLTMPEVENLSVDTMIVAIVNSFDLDGDGHLKFDEFKLMFEKMSTLTPTHFESICEAIGADITRGVGRSHLKTWYEADTNISQIMFDYARVVLYNCSHQNNQQPSSPGTGQVPVCCMMCVRDKVVGLLGTRRYGECIDIVNYVLEIEDRDSAAPFLLVESCCAKPSNVATASLHSSSRVWLVYHRADALFRLMRYADALVDYKWLAAENVSMKSAGAGTPPHVVIRNRIKTCSRKCKNGGEGASGRKSPPLSPPRSPDTRAAGGDIAAALDSASASLSCSAVPDKHQQQVESESLSVDDLLATFKHEDKLRAKRRAKRLRYNAAKQKRLAAARANSPEANKLS